MFQNIEALLFCGDKKDRPIISFKMEKGSVKHIFRTSLQQVIAFNALIGSISDTKSIDFLNLSAAIAIENIQSIAEKKDYSFQINTSLAETHELKLDRNTLFKRTLDIWSDAEFYFYGKVTNAGGKDKANIHVTTKEFGTLRIQTPIDFLEKDEENILYKPIGIRALGKQHSVTGEIDYSSLKFSEIVIYQAKYDNTYLKELRDKAKNNWVEKVNSETWLNDLKARYES